MHGLFANNPYYVLYESQLIDLHRLVAEGKGGTAEANELREAMELPERELTDEEMKRLNRLSADLYMLQGREVYEQGDPDEADSMRLRAKVQTAWNHGDWIELLRLLRNGEVNLRQEQVALLRSLAYLGLNQPYSALRFAEHAVRLAPQDAYYVVLKAELLTRLGMWQDVITLARELLENSDVPLDQRITASHFFFQSTQHQETDAAVSNYLYLYGKLRGIVAEPEFDSQAPNSRALAQMVLFSCFERIGRAGEAIDYLNEMLLLNPSDTSLLVGRGITGRADPTGAVGDFRLAVDQGTQIATPYIFLAAHSLQEGDPTSALHLATSGLDLSRNPRVLAQLRHSIAVAKFVLGRSAVEVRREFEMARELDPLNEDLERDFQFFLARQSSGDLETRHSVRWPGSRYPDLTQASTELTGGVPLAA